MKKINISIRRISAVLHLGNQKSNEKLQKILKKVRKKQKGEIRAEMAFRPGPESMKKGDGFFY